LPLAASNSGTVPPSRALPGLIQADRFGLAAIGPVIGIAAQRHHGLVRAHGRHPFGHDAGEPALCGDRPGAAGQPVLVIGHQDHAIDSARIGCQIPLRIGHRRGDQHLLTAWREARPRLRQKGLVIAMRGGGQVFQIEHHAACVPARHRCLDPVKEAQALRRIGQQARHACAIPPGIALGIVLHHQQHRQPGLRAQDIGQFLVLRLDPGMLRPAHRNQPHRHGRQRAGVRGQRLAPGAVPGHDKADALGRQGRGCAAPGRWQPGAVLAACANPVEPFGYRRGCRPAAGQGRRHAMIEPGHAQHQGAKPDDEDRAQQCRSRLDPATTPAAGIVKYLKMQGPVPPDEGSRRGWRTRRGHRLSQGMRNPTGLKCGRRAK
jgi:hypothetical protein